MSAESNLTYTLFRRVSTAAKSNNSGITISFGSIWAEPKEAWQRSPENEGGEAQKDALEFVCHVKSSKEVAAAVRRDPLQEYVLFRGEMVPVKVMMPVFVDGKNLDTFDAEWGDKPAQG